MSWLSCLPQQNSCDDIFLEQFAEQVDEQVDDTWAESYSNAEELLAASRKSGAERQPILLANKWKENFRRPCTMFSRQLHLLRKHWGSLKTTLAKVDGQRDYDEYKDATADIVSRVVEDHYRGLLQLQVYQYWHRSLYDRCIAALGDAQASFLAKNKWWCDKDAMEFRSAGTLTREMRVVVARYAEFRTHLACDKAGVPRTSLSYRVKHEEAEAMLSRRRIAKEGTSQEFWQFGVFSGIVFTFVAVLAVAFDAQPVATYSADLHLWHTLPYFRGLFVFYLAILLWGLVLRDMESHRVNYPYLLGLQGEAVSSLHVLKIGCILLSVLFTCFTLYILDVRNGISVMPFVDGSPKAYVVVNFLFPFCMFLYPFDWHAVIHTGTKRWLLRTLGYVMLTPFIPVTFASNFLTDYMTSMVKVLLDLSVTACVVLTGDLWNPTRTICVPTGGGESGAMFQNAALFCTLTPLVWRFLQCSRKAVIEPIIIPKIYALDLPGAPDSPSSMRSDKSVVGGSINSAYGSGITPFVAEPARRVLGRFKIDKSATVLKIEEENDELCLEGGVARGLKDEVLNIHLRSTGGATVGMYSTFVQKKLILTYHEETAWLHAFPCLVQPPKEVSPPSPKQTTQDHFTQTSPYIVAAKEKLDRPVEDGEGIAVDDAHRRTVAWQNVRLKAAKLMAQTLDRGGFSARKRLEAKLTALEAEKADLCYYLCYLNTPEFAGVLTLVPTACDGDEIESVIVLYDPTAPEAALGATDTKREAAQTHIPEQVTSGNRSVSQPLKRRAAQTQTSAGEDLPRGPVLPAQYRFREGRRQEPSVLFPHFYNLMKYCCSVAPIVYALLFGASWEATGDTPWPWAKVLYILLLCVSTVYSFTWDIFVDWGLWRREGFPKQGMYPLLGFKGWVWRKSAVDFSTGHSLWWYFALVVFNLAGRCAWAITLVVDTRALGVTGVAGKELLILITASVEVARRSVWARLRLGHEQTVDVGHYRAGDGYSEVPPLITRSTPWTVPGEYSVLRTFKLDTLDLDETRLKPVQGASTTTLAPSHEKKKSGWFTHKEDDKEEKVPEKKGGWFTDKK